MQLNVAFSLMVLVLWDTYKDLMVMARHELIFPKAVYHINFLLTCIMRALMVKCIILDLGLIEEMRLLTEIIEVFLVMEVSLAVIIFT